MHIYTYTYIYIQLHIHASTEHPENVVAVHCKGGKGRTGTMVCAWLLYSKSDFYAEQVLKMFAHKRTDEAAAKSGDRVGVDGPSQIRYVEMFEKLRLAGVQGGYVCV
jgi:hypothetical protein